MLADVVGGEGADRHDRALVGPQVGEHAGHQPVGHALASEAGVGLDVGDHERRPLLPVVGDRHDVVVDDEFVALAHGVVANRVFHARIVTPKPAPTAVSTP